MRILRLTLRYVEARLPDLSVLDSFDTMLLRFIEEKYQGIAPMGEINALAILGALAPKWKEMISIPAIQPFIPEDLMQSLTAGLAERELDMRFQKLENLGLIERIPGEGKDKGKVMLTDVGKAIAVYSGIPTDKALSVIKAYFNRLRIELPPQSRYVLQPNEKVVVSVREEMELRSNEVAMIFPTPNVAMFGLRIANNVVLGPYSGSLELIIVGGYVPIILEHGQEIAVAMVMRE